jgi:hypothetical protein
VRQARINSGDERRLTPFVVMCELSDRVISDLASLPGCEPRARTTGPPALEAHFAA